MHWADVTLFAGLLTVLAGAALTLRQVARRRREPAQQRYGRKVEDIADVACQAVLFGGGVLLQLSTLGQHISDGAPPCVPWFTALAGMSMVLLFGFQLGRLFMRWQVRNLLAAPENGETRLGATYPPSGS